MALEPIYVEMTVAESTQQYDMTVSESINPSVPASGVIGLTENGIANVGEYLSADVSVLDSYLFVNEVSF